MKENFPAALGLLLKSEGGFVDNPADPGGATNFGITQRTYDVWRNSGSLTLKTISLITQPEVTDIYKTLYWDKASGDQLPSGVDYAMFDFAVNSGPSRAAKFLQYILSSSTDIAAAAHAADPALLIFALCFSRLRFMQSLHTWDTFGAGWSARVLNVMYQSIKLARGSSS